MRAPRQRGQLGSEEADAAMKANAASQRRTLIPSL
jgi:hypothetical protein